MEISTRTHSHTSKKDGEGQADGGDQVSHSGSVSVTVGHFYDVGPSIWVDLISDPKSAISDESLRPISDPKYKKPQVKIWGLWGYNFELGRILINTLYISYGRIHEEGFIRVLNEYDLSGFLGLLASQVLQFNFVF